MERNKREEGRGKIKFLKKGLNFHLPFSILSPSSQRGFTMIEILLVATIFATVSTISFSIFGAGMQIWKRSQGVGLLQRKALLTFEKMGRDIRTSYHTDVKELKGSGDSSSFAIPAMLTVRDDKMDMMQYGRIHYQWNSGNEELCKSEETASDMSQKTATIPCRVLLTKIKRLKFSYMIYEGIGDGYSWYDSWDDKAEPPLAIQLEMSLDTSTKKDRSSIEYKKTFFIPTGGKHEEAK